MLNTQVNYDTLLRDDGQRECPVQMVKGHHSTHTCEFEKAWLDFPPDGLRWRYSPLFLFLLFDLNFDPSRATQLAQMNFYLV